MSLQLITPACNGEVTKGQRNYQQQCIKCQKGGTVLLHDANVYCKDCFLHYATHKFRATLGKSKALKNGDRVLVAFSGGEASVAMWNLIQQGFSEDTHKKVQIEPILLHIVEDSEASKELLEHFRSKTPNVLKIVEFDALFQADIRIENSIDNVTNSTKVAKLLTSRSSTAGRELRIRCLRYLIWKAAIKFDVAKVFVGDTMTSLSNDALGSVAMGRGAQIHDDSAVFDKRFPNLTFIRPMREFSSKEVALYNRFHRLSSFHTDTISKDLSTASSIQNVTKRFATGLQSQFPSTINTIFSTIGKIHAGDFDDFETCQLCFSKFRRTDTVADLSHAASGGTLNECSKFCYACGNLLNEVDVELLPPFLQLS